ncbi:ABCG5, partial [Symbiodinium necroappetens]
SGGEQRRLALACALAGEGGTQKSKALLADEPTTGLDTFQAADMVQLLGELGKARRCATILTIHQPRSSVWSMIEDVLLLAPGGQSIFCGPTEEDIGSFEDSPCCGMRSRLNSRQCRHTTVEAKKYTALLLSLLSFTGAALQGALGTSATAEMVVTMARRSCLTPEAATVAASFDPSVSDSEDVASPSALVPCWRCGGPTGIEGLPGLEGLLKGLTAQLMPMITEMIRKDGAAPSNGRGALSAAPASRKGKGAGTTPVPAQPGRAEPEQEEDSWRTVRHKESEHFEPRSQVQWLARGTEAFDEVTLIYHHRKGKEFLYRFRGTHKFGDKDIVPLQGEVDNGHGSVGEVLPARSRALSQREIPDHCKLAEVEKDGACLYHAIAEGLTWLTRKKETHRDLRARANAHIRRHSDQYLTEWHGLGPSLETLVDENADRVAAFSKDLDLAEKGSVDTAASVWTQVPEDFAPRPAKFGLSSSASCVRIGAL